MKIGILILPLLLMCAAQNALQKDISFKTTVELIVRNKSYTAEEQINQIKKELDK